MSTLHSQATFYRIRELTGVSDACLPLGVLWSQAETSTVDRTPRGLSGDLGKVMLMSAVVPFVSPGCLLSSVSFMVFGLTVTLVMGKQQTSVDGKMEDVLLLHMAGR